MTILKLIWLIFWEISCTFICPFMHKGYTVTSPHIPFFFPVLSPIPEAWMPSEEEFNFAELFFPPKSLLVISSSSWSLMVFDLSWPYWTMEIRCSSVSSYKALWIIIKYQHPICLIPGIWEGSGTIDSIEKSMIPWFLISPWFFLALCADCVAACGKFCDVSCTFLSAISLHWWSIDFS